jgi:hypothetical protein
MTYGEQKAAAYSAASRVWRVPGTEVFSNILNGKNPHVTSATSNHRFVVHLVDSDICAFETATRTALQEAAYFICVFSG